MSASGLTPEVHLSHRSNWLRAAVLGANDGILSTASLVLGVAASGASAAAIVTAGIAGLVAGALSMAAGEYVSVSSQRDAEQADIRLEERELRSDPQGELRELAGLYEARGLPPALAGEVAVRPVAPRRAAGAPPRRARARRAAARAAVSGRLGVGGVVLGGRGAAAAGRRAGPGSGAGRRDRGRHAHRARGRWATSAPAWAGRRGAARTIRVVVWGAIAMAITAGDRRARRDRH